MKKRRGIAFAGAVLGSAGCLEYHFAPLDSDIEPPLSLENDTATLEELVCYWTDSFTQREGTDYMYDMFLVVDNSGSMYNNVDSVNEWLGNVWNQLPSHGWQVFAVSIEPYNVLTSSRGPFTESSSASELQDWYNNLLDNGDEAGFDALSTFISSSTIAQTWMRPDAFVGAVFVSDENDHSNYTANIEVAEFTEWYETIGPDRSLSSIVHPDRGACYDGLAGIGTRYMEATNYFGGRILDICSETSWSSAFRDLPEQIDPYDSWPLTYPPLEETIRVFVDGPFYPWHYDTASQSVVFDNVPDAGSKIEIKYQIDPKTIDGNQCPTDTQTQ